MILYIDNVIIVIGITILIIFNDY